MIEESDYKDLMYMIHEEIFNKRNFELVDRVFTSDAIVYDGDKKLVGRDEIKKFVMQRSEAVPDLYYVLDGFFAKDNKVAIRWHAKGDVKKPFADFKVGETATFWGISLFNMKEGRITRNWHIGTPVDIPPQD